MTRRVLPALLLVSLLAPMPRAHADPRIVNGVLTSDYPTTGSLLYANGSPATENNAGSWCTGTLIGCETFLTAAHCVIDDPTPGNYQVFFQHAGFFAVTSIATHPAYPSSPDATGDVAVLTLGTPLTGIAPTPVNEGPETPVGTTGTIVGFGQSGGSVGDYGLKRAGDVLTASCGGQSDDDTSLCWEYEAPIGPPGDDSNTCNGDSGGPLFVAGACGEVVVGATSFGINAMCLDPDLSVDASVFAHLPFIQAEGGADLDTVTCGSISHVGDLNTTVNAFTGTVSGGSPEGTHSFAVPGGITALRVALNAIDDGSDFDLYLRQGSPPTTGTFDCAHTGGNQYGYCEVASPAADTWYVLVNRVSGSGTYQVTATTFTGTLGTFTEYDGNVCASGSACMSEGTCAARECTGGAPLPDGTPCDDASLCTEIDECQSGACVGDATPRTTCKAPPGKSLLLVKDRPGGTRNRLVWRWLKGPESTVADFEDPTSGAPDYTLCVYDEAAGTPSVALAAVAPGGGTCTSGPCWNAIGAGYRYADRGLSPDGLLRVLLKGNVDDRAKVLVIGKGASLPLAGPVGSEYFAQDSSVHVHLVQDDGDCWGTEYTSAVKNEPELFKAKCGSAADPCP